MDGADPIQADQADLLSEAAVARLRQHPRFREAVEAFAVGGLRLYEDEEPATRWLTKDLGRAGLLLGAALLDTTPGGLTVTALAAVAAARQVCSRGRVLAFIQYALASGRLVLQPGPEPWVRRRLTLTPAFIEPMRRRLLCVFQATAIVAPEVAAALPRIASDVAVQQATIAIGLLLTARPELNRNPGGPLRQIFIARDGGMRILQQLMLRQPPDRARLLEAAPLSRADLSRRHGVSRTHVNRLLAEAEAAGALTLDGPRRVVFSPGFSDEMENYFAGQLQVMRAVAQTMTAALH
ncbi:MAG TPA: hypothetical protein VFE18_03150 [Phenylobacterium sp.]|jgi:hypothetical protein|uniref:hypothetical protein n=1 Tax=Phenylobacterium sp. TaxID=1871053 RepID=UPI002D642C9A|nr:hypothetical protein [Phenylobacterium sp.]HZZ67148.1 hypothetical protein [Phenylobacterium sp.]